MRGLFSLDSKVMKVMGRIGDMILLNVLFLLTSLPVFTIGASSAALYSVCFRLGTEREGQTLKGYFAAFRSSFKQATVVWLILLAYLLCAGFSTVLFYHMQGGLRYLCVLFAVLCLLGLTALSYAFPLISRFENDTKGVLYNSFVFSLAWFPRSLLMAALNVFPVLVMFLDPYLYIRIGIIWYILYFSVAACVNVRLLRKVFAPFLPQEERTEENEETSEMASRE